MFHISTMDKQVCHSEAGVFCRPKNLARTYFTEQLIHIGSASCHLPVIANRGAAAAKEHGLEWSEAISGNVERIL